VLRWLRRFKAGWEFARAAEKKQELEQGVPAKTRIAGMAIVNGIRNRGPVCRRCFAIYTPKEYEFAERFQVRSILHIPDGEPDPMFCEACFRGVVAEVNHKWTNPGSSNSGPPNLLLQHNNAATGYDPAKLN
jgi:hypothetical protein